MHVFEPGLVEVAACDEETAPAAVAKMGERWATSGGLYGIRCNSRAGSDS
ncbi:DUF6207 family protein [Streptomyces atratus]